MLVMVKDGSRLSGAEARVVEALRSGAACGVAMVNFKARARNGTPRQVDLAVWTPHGLAVIEVKGFRSRQSGELRVSDNSDWTVGGETADCYTQATGSPVDQVEHAMFAVKNCIEHAGVDPGFVCAAVVLVPRDGARVWPERTELGRGVEVLVGEMPSASGLIDYVRRLDRGGQAWTTTRLAAAFEALDLSRYLPPTGALVAEGFESPTGFADTGSSVSVDTHDEEFDALEVRPRPTTYPWHGPDPIDTDDVIGYSCLGSGSESLPSWSGAAYSPSIAPYPYSVYAQPRRRHRLRRFLIGTLIVVGMLWGGSWLYHQVLDTDPAPAPTDSTVTVPPPVEPAAPPRPPIEQPAPPPAPVAPPPPPAPKAPCNYPFQPGC